MLIVMPYAASRGNSRWPLWQGDTF